MHQTLNQNARILVCGAGSIGERHIQNLLTLNYKDIILYRERNQPFRTLDCKLPTFKTLEEALSQNPEIAFITNPTHLHLPTALACAKAACHLFIEKPVSHTTNGAQALAKILTHTGKSLMVGYMMRFHPCLLKIKSWIDTKTIGTPIYLHTQWGEYLPDWHPWEDYRHSYAAKANMGGGPALTLSHDIDTVLWLLGHPNQQKSLINKASALEIDTEHAVDILLKFPNGATASIHLDYIQKPPSRTLTIVGTTGRIHFDYYQSTTTRWTTSGKIAEIFDISETFDRNQLFFDEVQYFFNCIKNKVTPHPNLAESLASVKIAQKAVVKG